ncbi:prepilin-type N-terminal cleavage/methylation domain-containing protein [Photobacterium damselae subsp. damselae]|uniref:GspH/FimT family pseudopilin n=1 Tax=Photobacterium damselae TaxID=38293 RepID=UPI0010FEBD90|nr:GspH/FimT family pseudopilin [Photobacterium damselae]MBA5682924.1 GspH/FimT family pseudopilin [Photobacterium damselae subsp. damselae]MDC4168954.1 prepilin-type N-terminal cleavage/methylation domain-containing protein [Photobacterium damselae]TLS81653.1 prepilin-type N-terminal cleavage/methylation domain-containing protein [Photobacterium damselae subsp. damselae]TLS87034.1 prepilin-type N-terminal cleavage/methylation domain-containing protein [Photobacterium damselae subsp. damselae]
MARETLFQLHHLQQNSLKCRGFTLLELIIAMSVMVVLLGAAVPSFSDLIERNKIKRLATEIEWLLVHAKSEAVMRGDNVQVAINDAGTPTWSIISKTTSGAVTLAEISSENFSNIELNTTFRTGVVTFNKLNGKPNFSGGYQFNIPTKDKVKVAVNTMTGRIYSCGVDGAIYGYKECY